MNIPELMTLICCSGQPAGAGQAVVALSTLTNIQYKPKHADNDKSQLYLTTT